MTEGTGVEDLLRQLAPQVLGTLIRRHNSLDWCEDAVQEALIEAAIEWPKSGIPERPRGWLLTVANRRLIDQIRGDRARRQREERVFEDLLYAQTRGLPGEDDAIDRDDSLILLFLCCHPALTPPSQIALTLRAVGGLTTQEIASAFFVPEATMAQRISRAKQRIRNAGATFTTPPRDELDERLRAVMHVLYLIFNEGYTSSVGPEVNRPDLTREAIRLTRELRRLKPDDSEVTGLLALMLLTDARRPARTQSDGELIPFAEQDRRLWDRALINEGIVRVTDALASGPLGAYQLRAAIAAVYDEAASVDDTDWPQILALYEMLDLIAPNPVATLNRALAVAMVHGPDAGLDLLATLETDDRVAGHHRMFAMRGHLLEMAGQARGACDAFEEAARRTESEPERRALLEQSERLRSGRHDQTGGGTAQ